MTPRTMFAAAAGIIIVAGLGLAALLPRIASPNPGGAQIGGPFTLENSDGKTVTDRDFRGRWQLVYFGYTHCPDVCPTTLTSIGAAIDKMPAEARNKVGVLFVTVDPERDTPKVVGDYAHAFGPAFVGLTGTPAQLAPVEQEFRVYAAKHVLKGGDYAMDHSSVIYVLDPDGRFTGLLDDSMDPADMAHRLVAMGA